MKTAHFLLIVISVLFCTNTATLVQTKHNGKIKWKKFKTEEEVHLFLSEHISANATTNEVTTYLDSLNLGHSDLTDGVIYAGTPEWSVSFWIAKEWLMEFYFDENRKLKNFIVKAGLTGP